MMKQFGPYTNTSAISNNYTEDVKRKNTIPFSEQVNAVTNFFDKWNECERTVVLYALIKRLHYSSLRFLQNSIDNTLSHKEDLLVNHNLSLDNSANSLSYLQNLLNAYKTADAFLKTLPASDLFATKNDVPPFDHSSMQHAYCDERKVIISKKHDILSEVLNMLPLLKSGNNEVKAIYLAFIPIAVKDTLQLFVSAEIVKQMFSYLLIHSAFSSEDRRLINIWRLHLENHNSSAELLKPFASNDFIIKSKKLEMFSGNCSEFNNATVRAPFTAFLASSMCDSDQRNGTAANKMENFCHATEVGSNKKDWQTIAPPHKQYASKQCSLDWCGVLPIKSGAGHASANGVNGDERMNILCDKLTSITNGLTTTTTATAKPTKQNSLGMLSLDIDVQNTLEIDKPSNLVNNVTSLAKIGTKNNVFNETSNNAINIELGSVYNTSFTTDQDSSFSKNGIEIVDFKPDECECICQSKFNQHVVPLTQPQQYYPNLNEKEFPNRKPSQFDLNCWNNLDGKLSFKTRRSNSLTTQTLSSFSNNYYLNAANENYSDSIENLAEFANKPRSLSLSIEQRCDSVVSSSSDTRLNELKPNYMKFHSKNVGMSSLGMWLKSLRLHKYINLFKNMSYDDLFMITEENLQNLGVTKGASHKLTLCIQKLKERFCLLSKLEIDLTNGHMNAHQVIEELAHIVLTPMKPIEAVYSADEENVAKQFLRVVFLVCSIIQKDRTNFKDDENILLLISIIDRLIHNEAFACHVSQLKEVKFKISEIKTTQTSKHYFVKQSINGNLNKARLNGKIRKCDGKSNDRINQRKHSNDVLNCSLSCLQHLNNHHIDYEIFKPSPNLSNQQINQFSPQHSTSKNLQYTQQKQQQQQQQKQNCQFTNTIIASFAPVEFPDEVNKIDYRPKLNSFDIQLKKGLLEQTAAPRLDHSYNSGNELQENALKNEQPFSLF